MEAATKSHRLAGATPMEWATGHLDLVCHYRFRANDGRKQHRILPWLFCLGNFRGVAIDCQYCGERGREFPARTRNRRFGIIAGIAVDQQPNHRWALAWTMGAVPAFDCFVAWRLDLFCQHYSESSTRYGLDLVL